MPRQVINPATWDRQSWYAGMRERAAELIAEGANGEMLGRFEASANQWLRTQGVYDPAAPFAVLGPERDGQVLH